MALQTDLRLCRHGPSLYLIFFILLLAQLQVTVVAWTSGYYTAAVFEHVRYDDPLKSTPQEAIRKNLEIYSTAASTAAEQEADIIVFPEWGLYRHDKTNRSTVVPFAEDIPDPSKEHCNPCEDQAMFKDRPVLLHLSCLAKNNDLYLVANIADFKKCIPQDTCETTECSEDSRICPPDGRKYFNTNVVFNTDGTLVSRYYKSHLYFEPDFNVPTHPEPAYFDTDFGLFTTFICFDMSFRESVEAVENKHVLNVAYPTFWYDHLPLMAAIQYQQAWAITNRVNLLAANVHLLGTGTIGSGIYSGQKGALVYTFNPDGEAKLLISKVPIKEDKDFDPDAKIFRILDGDVKDITNEKQDSKIPEQCSVKIMGPPKDLRKDYRCGELNTTDYIFKKLEQPVGSLEVCKNGNCCRLSYTADSMNEDFYLTGHSGIAWVYDTYGFCVETCMLIRCNKRSENNDEPCTTYPLTSNTRFHNFKLSGTYTTTYVYPSIMKSKMRLASTEEWEFENGDGHAQITYDSKSINGDFILAAGLYGRCYDRDPQPRFYRSLRQ